MRELSILMNGAMVRGLRPARKSVARTLSVAFADSMQRGMPTPLAPRAPALYGPTNGAQDEDRHHDYAEDQIDLLTQHVAGVVEWPNKERKSHA